MRTNLRRIAAWMLTVMIAVGCMPVSAIGQDREEYSEPVSVSDLLSGDTAETKLLTFSWADEFDSYVYDKNTGRLAEKPYTLEVPAGSTVEASGLSMPPVEIRNHSENAEETKYLSIYNWRNTSLQNEQFTRTTTIYADTAYTLELQLFAQDETRIGFNFICGFGSERHTVHFGSPTLKIGDSFTESQIPTDAEISSFCQPDGDAKDYRFAGTWTIAKAGIPLAPDVVFTDENVAAWKFENSDGVLIDIAADWEVRVAYAYTDAQGVQQSGEAWILRGSAIGDALPEGYVFTDASGAAVTAETVVSAPMTLNGTAPEETEVQVTLVNLPEDKLSPEAIAAIRAIWVGMPVSEISIPGFVQGEYVTYQDGTVSASPFDHWEWTDTTAQAMSLLDRIIPRAIAGSDTVTGQGVLTAVFQSIDDGTKLSDTSYMQSSGTYQRYTFSIPVYYYNAADGVTHTSTFSVLGPESYNNTNTAVFGSSNADVARVVGEGYEAVSIGIGASMNDLVTADEFTFTTTASRDGRRGSYTYTTTLTSKPTSITGGQAIYVQYAAAVPKATFNANGGSVTPEAVTGSAGDSFTFPTPSREGYVFKGWSTTAGGDVQYSAGSTGTLTSGNVTYYAVWAQAHTITFVQNTDGNGGGLTFTTTVEAGDPLSFPDLPAGWQVEGSTFSGWSKDKTGGTSVGENAVFASGVQWVSGANTPVLVSADTVFYAIWVPDKDGQITSAYFHIRLDGTIPFEPSSYDESGYTENHGMSGSIKAPVSVNNNLPGVAANINAAPSSQTILDKLHKSNQYTEIQSAEQFDQNYKVVWYVIKKQCWDDKTNSYTDWHVDGVVIPKESYLVKYHANGGTGVPDSHPEYENASVSVKFDPTPTRVGYTFLGWDEDPNATTPKYPYDGQTHTFTMPARDVTLYAIWIPNDSTKYTVEYYYSNKDDGTYLSAPTNSAERAGKTDTVVSVTDDDKTPKEYGYVLDDDAAGKLYSGTIAPDGSLVLRVYFKYSATNVAVNKQVYGNLGDPRKQFSFTATVKVNGEQIVPAEGTGYEVDEAGTITFTLTGLAESNSVTLTDIPTNAVVTVTEKDYSSEGYTTSYFLGNNETSGRSVELNIAQSQVAVTFRNARSATIDTGVNLDYLPYVLMLAVAGCAAAAAIVAASRRRKNDE